MVLRQAGFDEEMRSGGQDQTSMLVVQRQQRMSKEAFRWSLVPLLLGGRQLGSQQVGSTAQIVFDGVVPGVAVSLVPLYFPFPTPPWQIPLQQEHVD